MKRWISVVALVLTLRGLAFAEYGWQVDGGSPKRGSFSMNEDGVKLDSDVSENIQVVNVSFQTNENRKLLFTFISKNVAPRRATGIRAAYQHDLQMFSVGLLNVSDELRVGVGALFLQYLMPSGNSFTGSEFTQLAFGAGNYLKGSWEGDRLKANIRVGGDGTGSRMGDDFGNLTEWDSYRVGAKTSAELRLFEGALARGNADLMRVKYNQERYFFVQKWTEEYSGRIDLQLSVSRSLDIIPSVEYRRLDVERDNRIDLERPAYGLAVVRKNFLNPDTSVFLKGVYAPWNHKRGMDTLIATGLQSSSVGVEVYQRRIVDAYSTFTIKDNITGLRFSWKFGNANDSARKGLDQYQSAEDKHSFYQRSDSVGDEKSLTRIQQAERLGNLRRRIDWSGQSLTWKQAPYNGWGFRFQDEAYTGRAGDCDEQSCLNNSMDARNGYKAYTLAWWDFSQGYVGHGVELVQDPTNKQWFFIEYGVAYKVKTDPNGTMEQVMRDALAQNNRFSALPIRYPSSTMFNLRDCQTQGYYVEASPYYWLGTMNASPARPSLERGIDLFTKRGFLFDD